jgi:hypothetical protein
MYLPERTLVGGGLGSFGGQLGMRVNVAERQVPPYVPDLAMAGQQFSEDRPGRSTGIRSRRTR